jgi:Spy/CpxP family protein refolding chaperone
MKKQILTIALGSFLAVGAAIAAPQQESPAPPPQDSQQRSSPQTWHHADPNQQVQRLTKRLNLTADQQNQLLPILTDRQQQMEGIRNDGSLSAKDKHAKMRALREDSDNKIRAVLTDSQKQTYDQMQQQMRERMQQRHEQQKSESN